MKEREFMCAVRKTLKILRSHKLPKASPYLKGP